MCIHVYLNVNQKPNDLLKRLLVIIIYNSSKEVMILSQYPFRLHVYPDLRFIYHNVNMDTP